MPETLILKSQANEALKEVQAQGFDPSDFQWTRAESVYGGGLYVSKLVHLQTSFYFIFDFKMSKHFCEFSPGEMAQVERQNPGDWTNQLHYFRQWLTYLRREYDAPDMWAAIYHERDLFEASSVEDADNAQFSQVEIARLSEGLREIKGYLKSIQTFTPEQAAFLDARFQHLEDASGRLGRKDWVTLALGVFTSVILGLALTPDTARELLRLTGQVLSWLLKSQRLLP